MKRLFAAIKICPTPLYIQLQSQISSALSHERIKWVEPQNMHLTLKFFGETDERKIPAISQALDNAAAEQTTFQIYIENLGVFGSRYDPKVLWFGIRQNDDLQTLWRNSVNELRKIGFLSDSQNFVPHLTIGRIKELSDKPFFQRIIQPFKEVSIQQQEVSVIVLYESILRREGPEYIKIHTSILK